MAPVVAHSLENLQPSVKALADTGVKTVPSIYVKDETDRPKVPYNAFSKEIPVIDIAGLIGERRSGIVADIGRACSEWGIFQIINHGVTKSLTERIRAEAFEFFAMPLEEKTVYAAKPGQFVGYANGSILTDEKYMDWRELITLRCFPISSRNEDQWPRKPESFRGTLEEFSNSMLGLVRDLLGLISESLGQETQAVEKACAEGEEKVVMNYYPTCPQPDLTLGVKRHKDPGCLTVLLQDQVGGLQATKDDGLNWATVEPIEGALVVNLGDQLHAMSNGRYKSADHRAVVNSTATRMSIVVFYNPSPDCVVAPLPGLVDANHPALFEPYVYQHRHVKRMRQHMEKSNA